jgi:hypothetical protein
MKKAKVSHAKAQGRKERSKGKQVCRWQVNSAAPPAIFIGIGADTPAASLFQ